MINVGLTRKTPFGGFNFGNPLREFVELSQWIYEYISNKCYPQLQGSHRCWTKKFQDFSRTFLVIHTITVIGLTPYGKNIIPNIDVEHDNKGKLCYLVHFFNICLEQSPAEHQLWFKKWLGAVSTKPFLEPKMMFSRQLFNKMIKHTGSVTKINNNLKFKDFSRTF